MLLLALSLAAIVTASAALAASLRLALPGFLLAVYLLSVAQIVLLTEALSPPNLIGRWGYLLGQLPILAVALAVWHRQGRPRVELPRIAWRAAIGAHPVLAALALAVGVALAYEFVLAVTVPPNTWDSMTYHLSRAAAWYQTDAVEYIPGAHTTRQNVLPPNAEIQVLYTFAFLGRDVLVALPQYLAQLALVVAIYGIARRIGFGRAPSLFAALLFPTLAQAVLQSTSTQNDLAVAAPIAAAAYFAVGRVDRELPLAGLAFGLAIGTKFTVFPIVPVLVLVALLALNRAQLVELAAWCAAGVALLGAYGYLLNLRNDGTFLGDSPEAEAFSPEITPAGTISTAARIAYRFADFAGYRLDEGVRQVVERAGEFWFDVLGIADNPEESTAVPFTFWPNVTAHEDMAYFGPLGLLLVLPLSIGFAVAWAGRRVPRLRGALALAIPFFILLVALTHRYNPWIGRFMLIPVALTLPLAAALYPRRALTGALALVAVVSLVVVSVENQSKRITHEPWSRDRISAMTVNNAAIEPALRAIERRVPDDAQVGVILGEDSWDYPLYGERLERRLIPLVQQIPYDHAESLRLRWIVVDELRLPERPGWRVTRFSNGWMLAEKS